MKNTLLAQSGKMMVTLGVNYYRIFKKGDLFIELKWVNEEPVMLIYKMTLGSTSPAFMIEHKDAHKFAQSNGNASKELVLNIAMHAARAIGSEHDKGTAIRIIDAILNFMPELLMMPPPPKEFEADDNAGTGQDELSIKVDGKVIKEVLV